MAMANLVIKLFIATIAATVTLSTTTLAEIPRPRGVSLAKATLYQPESDESWTCLDGSKKIKFSRINDDYCDCADGSDEPGTSACMNGKFHCANIGHRAEDIPSSRVDDMICDCCDGSDEVVLGICQNTCHELGKAEQEKRKNEADLHKRGATKRSEMISRGKQMRAEREVRRAELERRRQDQIAIKDEKEQLKKNAEAIEAEALEMYKVQQQEREAANAETAKNEESAQMMRVEAEASFLRYDTNKDGLIEVTELQADMSLDQDRNGVVTIEEAKYFLDEREKLDFETFLTLSWPRIKPMHMLAEGLFKPPTKEHNEEAELLKDPENLEAHEDEQEHNEKDQENDQEQVYDGEEEEEEEGTYEDDDADVGVGSATPDSPHQHQQHQLEYDPETQRLIDLANEARNAYAQVENELRELEHEIKEIEDHDARDYGPNEEYATLDGECFNFEDREYVYSLCPFSRATQKQRSGGSETTLGRWDQWLPEGNNKYAKQKYSHGASCWNGPQRSAIVQLKCALEHRITSVSEPNRCEYFYEFETPAACDELSVGVQDHHDEL